MGSDVFDTIALTIHANDGEVKDRTTVQKLIYFHTVMIENLDISDYEPYFYGPFNREVAIALDDMTEFSYTSQSIKPGFLKIISYRLTEDGVKYARDAKRMYPEESERMSEALQTCKEHCDLERTPMSYAAKAHYILTRSEEGVRDGPLTAEDARTIAKNFDWNISPENASKGIELLGKLGLVTGA